MRVAVLRAMMIAVAGMEAIWGLAFYFHAASALGVFGRLVLDPVMARQYPLYIASAALAYGIAAISPRRYAGVIWICVAQRAVETAVAAIDWHAHAIVTSAFVTLAALELFAGFALSIALGSDRAAMPSAGTRLRRPRNLLVPRLDDLRATRVAATRLEAPGSLYDTAAGNRAPHHRPRERPRRERHRPLPHSRRSTGGKPTHRHREFVQ